MFKLPSLEARLPNQSRAGQAPDTDLVAVYHRAEGSAEKGASKGKAAPAAYAAGLERLRKSKAFSGRHGTQQFVRFGGKRGAENVLFMGFGAGESLTEERARVAGGHAWQKLLAEKCQGASVDVDSLLAGLAGDLEPRRLARALAEGLLLGAYQYDKYKSKPKAPKGADKKGSAAPASIVFVTRDKALRDAVARELVEVQATVEAIQVTRDWSNEPSNRGTPEYFAEQAQTLCERYGLKCRVLDEDEAAKEKMGLFLGVGQGAEREGRFVIVEYEPKGAPETAPARSGAAGGKGAGKTVRAGKPSKGSRSFKTVALVGKGVTFDSGGISIKPSLKMEDMKHDMTGAATVMGAVILASRWKIQNRVIAIMAFTENMPDGNAIQPGNILVSRSGKTVEVLNTDAEGRLILADALDFAQDMKPDAIVDVATLTGAVSIALGKLCCGIMGNDDELIERLKRTGDGNGERMWQLPLWDEYFDDLKSDYADMKNVANDSYGGTIRGGMFLKQFIRKGTRWAHLDIAATANNVSHLAYLPKRGASGLHVRTLARFAAEFLAVTPDRFYIEDASKHEGQVVTVRGWVYHKRSSGKIKFLVMRDGTGLMQCVLFKGECAEEAFNAFEGITQESSVEVTGKLRKEPRSPGGYEMGAQSLKVVQVAEPFPISPKEHGVEFLMEHRHLWIRSSRQWAALRVRSQVILAIHEFFHKQGFVQFDAPILTPSACEGTSTLFSTPYFEEKAYLTQSGQLYGETGAMAFGKVYVFGPTFRAEKSKTRKHLTEFWMVEPEMAYYDLEDNMALGEQFVEHVVQTVVSRCSEELKSLERDPAKLEAIRGPFPRISYDEALKILEKRGVAIPWGEDFGAPHETALGEEFGKPVFVHHMPSQIKAFYFKQSDAVGGPAAAGTGRYALGCDLIAPDGYGEIIGGGSREENVDVLKRRIAEHGLKEQDYSWYLDLRRYGSVPHSGFGMGIERTVAWITGVEHIRETIPYPRMLNTLRP